MDANTHDQDVPGTEPETEPGIEPETEPATEEDEGQARLGASLVASALEVEGFVAAVGWDQVPQLFALVPTAELVGHQPELARQLDLDALLTPVAQEPLPDGELDEALARVAWPDVVVGCALAQEIVVLPPDAEEAVTSDEDADLRELAASHPERREARLVAAVLQDGRGTCVMRLRAVDDDGEDQVVQHPDLAPNLLRALLATWRPDGS